VTGLGDGAGPTNAVINFATVPGDIVRVITHVHWSITPAAGVTATRFQFENAGGFGMVIGQTINPPIAAGARWDFSVDMGIGFPMLPGELPKCIAGLDAFDAANGFTAILLGYDIPRGNIQGSGGFTS